MNKIQDKRTIDKYMLLFSATYMIAHLLRSNFGAIVLEIQQSTQISKELLSVTLTGSAVAYGAAQLLSGLLGDRIPPKKLISLGLLVTTLMNLLIPFCTTHRQMLVVWGINGLAQAFLWPPMVKIMTAIFTMDTYKKHVVKISWGGSIGTILLYLCAPLLIATLGWKSVFYLSALLGGVMVWIWNAVCCQVTVEPRKKRTRGPKSCGAGLLTPLLLGILLAIVLQGMLRDGVTTWMPNYISETYDLSSVISILTGVMLPILSIVCCDAASRLYRTYFKNPLTCAAILFGVGAAGAGVLWLITGQSALLSILLSALVAGAMHGVNVMLISMIPPFYEKQGNVSTVSGVLNACTYVGSSIFTYGIAVLSEQYSWRFTVFVWFGVALLGTVVCLACVRPFDRFKAH